MLKAIDAKEVGNAIVRLHIDLPAQMEGQTRDSELREVLKEAHYFTIAREIQRETRPRLGNWTAEEITPIEALKAYLEAKKVSPERAKVLLEYGEKLIQKQQISQD